MIGRAAIVVLLIIAVTIRSTANYPIIDVAAADSSDPLREFSITEYEEAIARCLI